jgi:dUTP pyrophosphatase
MSVFVNNNSNLTSFINQFFGNTGHEKILSLKIFVDGDDLLKNTYINAAIAHNNKLLNEPHFYDAGFDLFLPPTNDLDDGKQHTQFRGFNTINKVDFKIKCCAQMLSKHGESYFSPFYTYARSSISKTPLRLANNQGIIDAGYRGPIIGIFDCISNCMNFYMDPLTRLIQICAPGLVPIHVEIVDSFLELGPSTSRGEGGIGSTGV